jgi:ribosomal protein S18 acetylase RimI-like enzyme
MATSIRMATPADADAARRVEEEAFATLRSVYRPNAAARANLFAIAPALERLVAEVDGRIVGTVRFGIFGDRLRVIGLAVLPTFRPRGVARALVEELARVAKLRVCRALALYTVTKTGNVSVFERLGFRVVSEQPDSYSVSPDGGALTEAYMEREVVRPSVDED